MLSNCTCLQWKRDGRIRWETTFSRSEFRMLSIAYSASVWRYFVRSLVSAFIIRRYLKNIVPIMCILYYSYYFTLVDGNIDLQSNKHSPFLIFPFVDLYSFISSVSFLGFIDFKILSCPASKAKSISRISWGFSESIFNISCMQMMRTSWKNL